MNENFNYKELSEEALNEIVEDQREMVEKGFNSMISGIRSKSDAVKLVNLFRAKLGVPCSIIGNNSPYSVHIFGQK